MKKALLYALFGIVVFSFAPVGTANAAGEIVVGSTTQPNAVPAAPKTVIALTRFTLQNTGTSSVTLTGLNVQQAGTAADSVIAGVLIWDEDIAVVGSKLGTSTFDSSHAATILLSFTVSAGQTRALILGVSMAADISAEAGKTVSLVLTGLQTSPSAPVAGLVPFTGGIQAVIPSPFMPPPQCKMSATPSSLTKGGSFTLKWSSINATSANIPGPSLGDVPVSGQANLIPLSSTRYIGTFIGAGGKATCETIITVFLTDGASTPIGDSSGDIVSDPGTFGPPAPLGQTPSLGAPPTIQAGPPIKLSNNEGSGLIPCTGINCQACRLADLAQNIINFLIGLSIPLAAAMFAYAGVIYFTSGVIDKIEKAKKIFTSVLIGFALVAGGWLIVQTILSTILSDSYKNWNEIKCIQAKDNTPGGRQLNKSINDLLGSISVLNNLNTSGQPPVTPASYLSGGQLTPPPGGGCDEATNTCWDKDGKMVDPVRTSVTNPEMEAQIAEACSKYGMSSSECAYAKSIAMNESSGGKNCTTSATGAAGCMQVLATTACGLDSSISSSCGACTASRNSTSAACAPVIQTIASNSQLGTNLGIQYYHQMYSQYGGSCQLAAAAYYQGPGNVKKYGGVPPNAVSYVNTACR